MKYKGVCYLSYFLFVTFMLIANQQVYALQYESDDFYQTEQYSLENGMRILINERDHANNVSIRLQVYYGLDDEPCGNKELPHFLEHLLFTGTDTYSENELDSIVENMGASWNASTTDEYTVYEIDTNSTYFEESLEIIHHIILHSVITEENVSKSRDIIHRESNNDVHGLVKWLRSKGFERLAFTQLKIASGIECESEETANHITIEDINLSRSAWYHPNNMRLIIVGKVGDDVKRLIENTFGQMSSKPLPSRISKEINFPEKIAWYSSFNPLIGDEVQVVFLSYWKKHESLENIMILNLIEEYLYDKVFSKLRVDEGLSYSPSAGFYHPKLYGALFIIADVDPDNIETAKSIISNIWGEMVTNGISEEDFEKSKRKYLLKLARNTVENTDFSDNYLDFEDYDLDPVTGKFRADEDIINKLTVGDVNNFITTEISKTPYLLIDEPTLTTLQFWMLVIISPFCAFLLLIYILYKKRNV